MAKGKAAAFASHLWIGISNNVSQGSGTISIELHNKKLKSQPLAAGTSHRFAANRPLIRALAEI